MLILRSFMKYLSKNILNHPQENIQLSPKNLNHPEKQSTQLIIFIPPKNISDFAPPPPLKTFQYTRKKPQSLKMFQLP